MISGSKNLPSFKKNSGVPFKDWNSAQVKAFMDALRQPTVPQEVEFPPHEYQDHESFTYLPQFMGTGKVERYFLGGTADRGDTSYYNLDGTFSHRKR